MGLGQTTTGAGKMPRHSFPVHFARYEVLRVYLMMMVLVVLGDMANAQYYSTSTTRACVCDSYDENVDYFPNKVEPSSDEGWSVEYFNSYKKVTDSTGNVTYLYLCGTPEPDVGSDEGAAVISIPVQRVSTSSSTNFAYFELLNQRDNLALYESYFGYVTGGCMIQAFADGLMLDLTNSANAAPVDVRFLSAYDASSEVPVIVAKATSASTPLLGAEWIKFFSLFFNREEAANDIYSRIDARYECSAAEAAAAPETPVLAAFQIDATGSWSTAVDEDCTDLDNSTIVSSYAIREEGTIDYELMIDAGATMAFTLDTLTAANGGNSNNITLGMILEAAADADVILFESTFYSMKSDGCREKVKELFEQTAAGAAGNVYDYGKLISSDGGTSWFEGKSTQPDIALRDLISILYPDLLTDYERVYLRKAMGSDEEDETIASASDCEDVNAPLYSEWRESPCNDDSAEVDIVGVESVSAEDVCEDAPSAAVLGATPAAVLATAVLIIGTAVFGI
ncbi:ABC-type enterochelin transport system, periplasmic component [Hondaea fermentalgiana]|uniref:ABC-type enterochelin transport system, periplasmic component n=1 Tax=Hondaea fermentalgiana TaxID=2315210 RepID=A0A2R5FZI0_9STRA|nr:ABC-type enterochelin transport system, periplasmic component [Hondaea fermentalgiana]|eukprot:GBG24166.1 ABC-type enterochelin transport system, periplasmic component [Hondaea fermentalgiana]